MSISIPQRLNSKLSQDNSYQTSTQKIVNAVGQLLNQTPFFFEEYTGHGIGHINRVLEIADKLIEKSTFDKLTSKDISILILAICIHDLGMFIKKDGLEKLIFTDKANYTTDILDQQTWSELWQDYSRDLRRYPSKKLKSMFGVEVLGTLPSVETLANLFEVDKRVFGEFLRQHHPRLAFEIADYGMLGSRDEDLFSDLRQSPGLDHIRLIGIVARSHGMSLRETESFINQTYASQKPLNVPVYYLMGIIRLADYLDAGLDRAPHLIDKLQTRASEISDGEWGWNQRIQYDQYTWDSNYDTDSSSESLNIHAAPTNSSEFTKIKNWLISVQSELDTSWAVIGQYYKSQYEFSIRRVTSLLLTEEGYAKFSKTFLPDFLSTGVNVDILKLMIDPLYRYLPSAGIRELLQNAVDACNERAHLEQTDYEPEISVTLDLDTEVPTFMISDNGLGMSIDTIKNYFLVAGSSYRNSLYWKRTFSDDNNQAQIIRSGRFGVGFFASYLLGDEATVITRHKNEAMGYQFTVTPDTDQIDAARVSTEVGTRISIPLKDTAIHYLSRQHKNQDSGYILDWDKQFYYDSPKIYYNGQWKQNFVIPKHGQEQKCWFNVTEMEEVGSLGAQWSTLTSPYDRQSGQSRHIYCNGLFVSRAINQFEYVEGYDFEVRMPSITFSDPQGQLPISLSRDSMGTFPEMTLVLKDVYRHILAGLLYIDEISLTKGQFAYDHPLISDNRNAVLESKQLIFNKTGYSLAYKPFMNYLNIEQALTFSSKDQKGSYSDYFDYDELPFLLGTWSGAYDLRNYGAKKLLDHDIDNVHIFIRSEDYSEALELESIIHDIVGVPAHGVPKLEQVVSEESSHGYLHFTSDRETPVTLSSDLLSKLSCSVISYMTFSNSFEAGLMSELIETYLGEAEDCWIPYSLEERKKKFPKAFEELSKYCVIQENK